MNHSGPAPPPRPTSSVGPGETPHLSAPVPDTVLREKVRRPETTGLARDRLEAPLAADDCPGTTLVIAPAGSGKTTLLTRVAATCSIATAWYRAGPEDLTEALLVRHLERALAAGAADTIGPGAAAVDELVARLEATGDRPVHLVVDDLHELAGAPAERALERFLLVRPRWIRVSLGSRRPPDFNCPRMLASGSLTELDGDDLRFRSWEVEELFRRIYREPLSPEATAALTRRTGGWAAGLQLFHLATRGKTQSEREAAVVELGGRSRLIRTYLTRNVLDELSPERRLFLLRTCTLGTLTGDLCDELLETTGSASVLAELERQQFFTTSTDDGLSYRYHQVLSSHLEALLLDEVGGVEAGRWHSRSAQVLEGAGRVRDALRAFARADDWASVARLIRQSPSLLSAPDDQVGRALARSPGWQDDPWLALAQARRLLRGGAVEASVSAFQEAEQLLDSPDFRRRCRQERAAASLWLGDPPPLGAPRATTVEGVEQLAAAVRAATRRIPEQVTAGEGVLAQLGTGVVRLLSGDLLAAHPPLTRVVATAPRGSWERLCAELASVPLDLAEVSAPEEARHLEEIAITAELEGQPWVARLARGAQAAVLLTLSSAPWSVAACSDSIETCRREGDPWGEAVLGICRGVALLLVGQGAEARASLAQASRVATSLQAPVLGLWADGLSQAASTRPGTASPARRAGPADQLARDADELGAGKVLALAQALLAAAIARSGRGEEHPPHAPSADATGRADIHCLGGFHVARGGVEVDVSQLRPRARALLQVLAIQHGHDVHRERLIDLLWPDAALPAGTRRLQVAVSSVRRLLSGARLGDDVLERHGDAYRLEIPGARHDLDIFAARVRRSHEHRSAGNGPDAVREGLAALEAYRGDLLPEVGPAEWVVAERERLRMTAAEVAGHVARLCLELGHHDEGLLAARRSVQLDPFRDTAWLLLAALQESAGDPSAASATRRRYSRITADLEGRPLADGIDTLVVSSGDPRPAPGAPRGPV